MYLLLLFPCVHDYVKSYVLFTLILIIIILSDDYPIIRVLKDVALWVYLFIFYSNKDSL